jgi:hypothetical protein
MADIETHLLGYLKPEQWADALKHGYSKEQIKELLERQEEAFPSNIKSEVEELIEGEFE